MGETAHDERRRGSRRRGFALLTVLFGLAVVSVLFAASLSRTEAHVMVVRQATNELKTDVQFEGAAIVARVLARNQPWTGRREIGVELGGDMVALIIEDVDALTDINSANAEALASALSLAGFNDPTSLAEAIIYRRIPNERWQDPRELMRLELFPKRAFESLVHLLTVRSGRAAPVDDTNVNQRARDTELFQARKGHP